MGQRHSLSLPSERVPAAEAAFGSWIYRDLKPATPSSRHFTHATHCGGDLLRSVPHIKFGDKIKSHRYLDHSGWLGLIYCSNYRDHWRLLLFELETKILWLLKSVCHTVTLRFLHALGPIKAIYLLFMLPNATNFSLNLEHISDFRYIHKQKSYAPNGDFVPFAKFGFVTVWQRKFEYFLPIIGFQKGQSNFLHDFIQVKANQKHITWKI